MKLVFYVQNKYLAFGKSSNGTRYFAENIWNLEQVFFDCWKNKILIQSLGKYVQNLRP